MSYRLLADSFLAQLNELSSVKLDQFPGFKFRKFLKDELIGVHSVPFHLAEDIAVSMQVELPLGFPDETIVELARAYGRIVGGIYHQMKELDGWTIDRDVMFRKLFIDNRELSLTFT